MRLASYCIRSHSCLAFLFRLASRRTLGAQSVAVAARSAFLGSYFVCLGLLFSPPLDCLYIITNISDYQSAESPKLVTSFLCIVTNISDIQQSLDLVTNICYTVYCEKVNL